MKKNLLLALFFVAGLAACSDDDHDDIPENAGYPVTHFSKIELSETIHSDGAPAVDVTHTYNYNAGRLTGYTYAQRFVAGYEPMEISGNTQVTYGDHQAVVTDETGNVSTYTLDNNGYAISCIRNEAGGNTRSYTFTYLINTEGKYYLENITETLGNDTQPYSSVSIDYNNYRTLRITEQIGVNKQSFTATTAAGDEIANISEIPCLHLANLYPLSLHSVALYGKIIGDSYDTLITQVIPDNNEYGEVTTYRYQLNGQGIVTSCSEVTSTSNPRAEYTRTVNYLIEKK